MYVSSCRLFISLSLILFPLLCNVVLTGCTLAAWCNCSVVLVCGYRSLNANRSALFCIICSDKMVVLAIALERYSG